MRQSGFAKKIKESEQAHFLSGYKAGRSLAMTQILDVILITLHENFGFGPDRVAKFFDTFSENWQEWQDLAKDDAPDKAYVKALIDTKLRASVPADRFTPWSDRYEYDFDPTYDYEKGKWI